MADPLIEDFNARLAALPAGAPVCVGFSGGLDSVAGAVREVVAERKTVALVGHRPSPAVAPRQSELLRLLSSRASHPPLLLPVRVNLRRGLGRESTQRSRTFLYASLGAAFAARAAGQESKVVALAVVSPGAAIEGFDMYHPFAEVRMLPSFIAAAKEDNVAREPVTALGQMAREHGTVKNYDGRGHGAFGLGQEGTQLFTDLVEWLMSVYDAGPVERTIVPREGSDKKKGRKG